MPLTKGLLIASVVGLVAHVMFQTWMTPPLASYTSLATHSFSIWTPVQWLLYPLCWVMAPRSALLVVLYLLVLGWAVGGFEERFGTRRTAQLMAAASLVGGLMAFLAGQFTSPDRVFGPDVWVYSGWSALGWALRKTPMTFLGRIPMEGVALVWMSGVLAVLNFLADPRVPTLVAELSAIGVGVAFVEWLSRPARYRTSTVVPIGDARVARERKNKKEWLN